MGYELDQLMKRNGVSTGTVPQYSGVKAPSDTVIPNTDTKAPVKYYTAPVTPTAPVMPTAPAAFAGTTPIAPTPLPKKGATADQKSTYAIDNAKYLADLNKFKTDQDAAKTAQTTYDTSLKSYPDLMKTYNTDLTNFNTDKTTWDELQRKYDLDQKSYNNYVDEYKNRIASTPQYDPLPRATGQTRPNTSMGQTALPQRVPTAPPSVSNADISSWAKQNPNATMQDAQKYQATNNLTNRDLYNATGSFYGNQLNPPSYGLLPNNFNNLTPQQQATNYAQQLNTGYTDADIKGKFAKQFGSPTDTNWTSMQNLAFPKGLPVSNTLTNTSNNWSGTDYSDIKPNLNTNDTTNLNDAGYTVDGIQYDENGNRINTTFARGGSVHHLARKYAVGGGPVPQGGQSIVASAMPNPEAGIPQPQPAPQAQPAPQQDDRMAQLQSMMEKYATPQNDYAQELEDARRKSNTETEAFTDMIKNARKSPERDNMSQAERYFRLAAAFGQPTKTGSFGETLGNVGQAMAENEKSKQQSEDQDLELQMKAQMMKAAGAKEDLGTLRALSSEDKKMQREMVSSMIKAEIESGKPQSELAKIAKDRYGYGTPEYYSFLEKNVPTWVASKMAQMQMGPVTAQGQLGVSTGQLDVARDRYNLSEKEYQDKMSGVIPPVELRKMEKLASKDQQTVENAAKQVNLIKNDITALKTHPGLSGITGMSGNIYKYPGSDRANAQTALESLQNKLEGYGKVAQSASGAIGAMAVAEWDKMRKQIANIDPVKLGEQGTLKALDNLSSDLDASVSMFKSQYEREHDTVLEHNPDKFQLKLNFGQRVNDEASAKQAGWVLHQDANGNKAYINPANKSEHLEIQ